MKDKHWWLYVAAISAMTVATAAAGLCVAAWVLLLHHIGAI